MPSLSKLKEIYRNQDGSAVSLGEIRSEASDLIMESTWDGDPQSRIAYIYDYFHDNESSMAYKLNSPKDSLKIPVHIKFIVHSYNADGKDQVSYHIQFKPSYSCSLDYYEQSYEKKYGAQFPIGLYIDIPDRKGSYRRWLIAEDGSRYDLPFDKYCVYPTNYLLHWIDESGSSRLLRHMWAVERMRNSYNAGVYTDRVFTRVENQTVLWLPMNSISEKLTYDKRLIVSAPIDCPLTWAVSKVENTLPYGINRLVLYQDTFNRDIDYVNLDTGEMYADYYLSPISPTLPSDSSVSGIHGNMIVSTKNIRVGGGHKKVQVQWMNPNGSENKSITTMINDWNFSIDNNDVSNLVDMIPVYDSDNNILPNVIKIQFLGDFNYLTKILMVEAHNPAGDEKAYIGLEILSL